MSHALIINPASGRGSAGRVVGEVKRRLGETFPEIVFYETKGPGHARDIAARLRDDGGILIVAGGDGTIHEVVNGMAGGERILGILPLGTGNDFARALNLPTRLSEAVDVLKAAQTMVIDVGKINDTYFINGMGMGFDADVVIESKKIKRLGGFALYLAAVLRKLVNYENRRIILRSGPFPGEREILLLGAGNGQYLGGGFQVFPMADLSDGKLDICIFRKMGRWEIIRHLPKAISGTHLKLEPVTYFTEQELVVEAPEGIPVHVDGELLDSALCSARISIVPQSLSVIHNC